MIPVRTPRSQQGVMLIEALVAILLFTFGVIAVMGMQAVSISQVSQAKYRTDASYLANLITGKMWVDQPNLVSYASAGSAGRVAWDAVVAQTLPSGVGVITVNGTVVTVTIQWRQPSETTVRQYLSIVNINPS